MADIISWGTVGLAEWVDYQFRRRQLTIIFSPKSLVEHPWKLTVRTGGGAAVGVVTKLVNVHASLSVGIIARNVPGNGGWGGLALLLESDGSGDLGVTTDGCNCGGRSTWSARILSQQRDPQMCAWC